MEIGVVQKEGRVGVTVLQPKSRVDGSNYTELIAAAQEQYRGGARNFLLDLSAVDYISSAGLVAMHNIAMLARFGALPDEESGWESFRAIGREAEGGYQSNVKLLSPQPRVQKVLGMSGMDQFLEVFDDLDAAVGAF
jgi:anti-anti-sigma regulatory factor